MAFPTTVLNLTVELALGADLTAAPSTWVWTDVTAYVYARDFIRIQRGRPDGATLTPPSLCQFTVDNGDGRWCAYDPSGAWFGQIGRGTPVRILVDEGTSSVRWTGFLSALPPRWSPAQTDRYVVVSAAGILQRLDRGQTPFKSALVRMISGTSTPPVAYWPAEEGVGATSIAEYFGGKPMVLNQVITFASDSPDGSNPLPEFTTVAGVTGTVPSHEDTGAWSVLKVFNFPAAPPSETVILQWYTTGTYPIWRVTLTPSGADFFSLQAFNSAGTMQIDQAVDLGEAYGQWLMLYATAVQNGADVDYVMGVFDGTDGTFGGTLTGTETGITAGTVRLIREMASSKLDGMHAGHWAVWNIDIDPPFTIDDWAIHAFTGEEVGVRVQRLALEEGIGLVQFGIDLTNLMGPQTQDTFMSLLRECEAVNGGRLYEHRDPTATDDVLSYKSGADYIANRDAALILNHDSGQLAPAFEPTDDDQNLRNDWTATRTGAAGTGSSARVVATEAEHSSLTPANVGTYADSVSVNVYQDTDLVNQAGWRVHIGTHEGLRFPVVTLDFARNPSLIADWIDCDIGSRIQITNPPAGIAPDDIDLLIEGWTETLGPYTWTAQLNCSPYTPWRVFELGSVYTGAHTDQTPAVPNDDEGTAVVTGTTLVFARTGIVTAISFIVPTTNTGTYTVGLFEVLTDDVPAGTGTGQLLASASVASGSVTAGTRAAVAITPTAVDRAHIYRAAVHASSGRFVQTVDQFDTASLTNGDVVAIQSDTTPAVDIEIGPLHNGTFIDSATLAYPNQEFGAGADYFVDVVFTSDYLGRLAGDEKCALRVAIDADDTALVVDPNYYRWTTDADDFPLNIRLGGEVVTLSGIATTALTFVGVGTATHADNTSVTPGFPAGTTTGDNLFVLAAIRSSGTGTVNTPTGYTRLPVFPTSANVQLYTKVDGGAESAPAVSFTGGAAGDTCSALMFAFRGLPVSLADLGDMVVGSITQLNASAQNIAYGGLYVPQHFGSLQLIIGWKQDDYTSVATPATFTEMIEASSTAGNDQSLYVAYRIDTTPAVTKDTSLAVTGGASAISRSAVVAIAGGFQTFTASARNVNGITGGKSHAVGTLVAVDDPAVLAL